MLYPRDIEKEILNELDSPRALFILGARRTGKTSLLQRIREQLPSGSKSLYIDFEDPDALSIVKTGYKSFLAYIDGLGFSPGQKVYVFLDEIQYLRDFASFIKLLVDHHSKRVKLILSGSSAAQIKFQFKDSLVGRKFIYELFPLTFREFVVFKEEQNLVRLLGANRQQADTDGLGFFVKDLLRYYYEYMNYGGYPEVVLAPEYAKKQKLLKEISHAYILKDIRNIFQVERLDSFNNLVKILALQVGQLLNVSSLSRDSKTTRPTAEKYINILEDTFIVRRVPPLFTNKKKELRRMPKIFFLDTGLRNYLINNFSEFSFRTDRGQLLENTVFSAMWKNREIMDKLFFWHTADGKEVDFILQKGIDYIPFEVKVKRTAVNHLKIFAELYNSPEMNLVRLDPGAISEGSYGQTSANIQVIPPWVI